MWGLAVEAQSAFDRGFEQGYKDGYCYDNKIGCVPPIAPVPPVPGIDESADSYKDGYNRGFLMGREAAKKEAGNKTGNSSSCDNNTYRGYRTATPKYVDYVYKPNYNLLSLKLQALQTLKKRAENYLENGQYKAAINVADRMLSIQPGLGVAYLYKSIAYYRLGQILNAYNYAEKAVRVNNTADYRKWRDNMELRMLAELIDLMKREKYGDILFITKNMWYSSEIKNLFRGLALYYVDRRKSKRYFRRVKHMELAQQYLKALKEKKYKPNPFAKKNSGSQTGESN